MKKLELMGFVSEIKEYKMKRGACSTKSLSKTLNLP